jgi:type IV pilus assembly protein PilM
MNLLPKASGSRPRLACEILPGGVVAARSPEAGLPLASAAKVALAENAVVPGLKPGNIADRVSVIAALRRAMEQAGARPNGRNSDVTLVIPDGAVRVLLLDFDTLPSKLSEALPIVRFRLKKLVPFEAEEAMVSFQVMSHTRSMVRVLAVATPRDVLSEYESVAREAGFEPGAVLPSTLATLAALDESDGASLVINAHAMGVTTAIVRSGMVLLHRSVEMVEYASPVPAGIPAALLQPMGSSADATLLPLDASLLPLVDREDTAGEWAAQEPLPEHGRNPYATEAAPVSRSPYTSATVLADLESDSHHGILSAPTAVGGLTDSGSLDELRRYAADDAEPRVHTLTPEAHAEEIARAVSVAVAYFEDSLGVAPGLLLSAGPLGADGLQRLLRDQGLAQEEDLRVRELVEPAAVASGVASASVTRGWLAGVAGALKS